MRNPNGEGDIEQDQQVPEAGVDARSGETGVEDAEGDAGCRESTTGGDVSSTSECQVAQDRIAVDLGGKDFKDGGE